VDVAHQNQRRSQEQLPERSADEARSIAGAGVVAPAEVCAPTGLIGLVVQRNHQYSDAVTLQRASDMPAVACDTARRSA
jgi:hypothetical protein